MKLQLLQTKIKTVEGQSIRIDWDEGLGEVKHWIIANNTTNIILAEGSTLHEAVRNFVLPTPEETK